MTYTASKLITNAYYISGKYGRGYKAPTGDDIESGLDWLNALLSAKTIDNRLIPYYAEYDFTAVIGQEKYSIPNLISVETFTFNVDTVRFPSLNLNRKAYFGTGRVDGVQALPFEWHLERTQAGADIFIYPLPSDTYPLKIWGKFSLTSVTMNQDLLLTMTQYYIDFLTFALAERICIENPPLQFSPDAQRQLNTYENAIMDISPADLTCTKMSSINPRATINWGVVNLGPWTVGQ